MAKKVIQITMANDSGGDNDFDELLVDLQSTQGLENVEPAQRVRDENGKLIWAKIAVPDTMSETAKTKVQGNNGVSKVFITSECNFMFAVGADGVETTEADWSANYVLGTPNGGVLAAGLARTSPTESSFSTAWQRLITWSGAFPTPAADTITNPVPSNPNPTEQTCTLLALVGNSFPAGTSGLDIPDGDLTLNFDGGALPVKGRIYLAQLQSSFNARLWVDTNGYMYLNSGNFTDSGGNPITVAPRDFDTATQYAPFGL